MRACLRGVPGGNIIRRVRALMLCLAAALCSGCATVSHLDEAGSTEDAHKASMVEIAPGRGQSGVESLSAVPPHPDLVTRSLPLARPSRASTFGRIPFAASQAAQVPGGEGNPLSCSWLIRRSEAQFSVGPALTWDWRSDSQLRPTAVDFMANTQLTLASDSSTDASASTSPPELNPFSKAYVGLVWDNIKETFTAPAHWDTCDWLV